MAHCTGLPPDPAMPTSTEFDHPFEHPPNPISTALIYVSIAVGTIGGLAALYGVFADLAILELQLPLAVRNTIVMLMVGVILLVGLRLLWAIAELASQRRDHSEHAHDNSRNLAELLLSGLCSQ